MRLSYFRKHKRKITTVLLFSYALQIIPVSTSYAITGYGTMPEYSSFEPVATTNMVNNFDGSFTYNIPLLNVPNGYPINLSYHSGDVSPESMASWVGLGWNINPGTINRIKRGTPDDWDGTQQVKYWSRMPKNWTISGGLSGQFEGFGNELGVGLGASIAYNNYNGITPTFTASVTGMQGIASLNFTLSDGNFGFQPTVNPSAIFKRFKKEKGDNPSKKDKAERDKKLNDAITDGRLNNREALSISSQHPDAKKVEHKGTSSSQVSFSGFSGGFTSASGKIGVNFSMGGMFGPANYAAATSPYNGFMARLKFNIGANIGPVPADLEGEVYGSYVEQTPVEMISKPAVGYLYSEKAVGDANNDKTMDYYMELDKTFEKRERYLGYPIPNNDMFSQSGEAMGGAFRARRSEFGNYRPNYSESKDWGVNAGYDFNFPISIPPVFINGVFTNGIQVGGSYHVVREKDWRENRRGDYQAEFEFKPSSDDPNGVDENVFFRYSGDKGGFHDLSLNDDPYKANLAIGVLNAKLDYTGWSNAAASSSGIILGASHGQTNNYSGERDLKQRSTNISAITNSELATTDNNGIPYKSYQKKKWYWVDDPVTGHVGKIDASEIIEYNSDISGGKVGTLVGEYTTTNTDGVTYTYGLPSYASKEKQLSYSLDGTTYNGFNGLSVQVTTGNDGAQRKAGMEADEEYAATYLLTQICSPDYVDRGMDGPSQDDFGSYTIFNYQRIYGGNEMYHHRSPYSKSNYSYGQISNPDDDMINFSYLQKEVYMLQSIASKTHVAIFTLTDREDGMSAQFSSNSPSANQLIEGGDGSTLKKVKKLDKIDLYAIADVEIKNDASGNPTGFCEPIPGAVPIKTVRFEYDYSRTSGIPNNSGAAYDNDGDPNTPLVTNEGGKLTLRKVWFEYGGKKTSKISPYEFHYEYPVYTLGTPTGGELKIPNPAVLGGYDNIVNFATNLIESSSYLEQNLSRWGGYRDYSDLVSKFSTLARFWNYTDQNPASSYDPAMDMLKRIILPSGGEIHVQYEQNDYMYVQDRRADMMVPLLAPSGSNIGTSTDETSSGINNKKYYLNLDLLGAQSIIDGLSDADRRSFTDDLFAPMNNEKKRIYFNFLYALLGTTPDVSNTLSEYLEGYARIDGYGYDYDSTAGKYRVFFTFKSNDAEVATSNNYYHQIAYDSQVSTKELPRKVCRSFYKSFRRGKLNGESSALETAVSTSPADADNDAAEDIFNAFTSLVSNALSNSELSGICQEFDPAMSYVRVRVPVDMSRKLGGGVRVKRLLMYDQGINSDNDVSLYGNEYDYTMYDDELGAVITSGVATNEPSVGRRENVLVEPLEKDAQSKFSAILFGRDMYSQEGPLGEGLLPSPSVGYRKVTIKPIHQGSTSVGRQEYDFFTCKEYPFVPQKTDIASAWKTTLGGGVPISPGSGNNWGANVSYTRQSPYMTQGYSFVSNSMHGQPKKITKYAQASGGIAEASVVALASEEYDYYNPWDDVYMMDEHHQISKVLAGRFGKESEILSARRQVTDVSVAGDIGVDFTTGGYTISILALPMVLPTPLDWDFVLNALENPDQSGTSFSVDVSVDEKLMYKHTTTKIINYPAIVRRVINKADNVTTVTENTVLDKYTGDPVVTKSYDDFGQNYLNYEFKATLDHKAMRSKSINERLKTDQFNFTGTAGGGTLTYAGTSGCADFSAFTRGDFIKISTGGSPATYEGLFHIDSVDLPNQIITLVNSGHGTLLGSAPTSATACTLEVVHSGFTNQLSSSQGGVMVHNDGGTLTQSGNVDNILNWFNQRYFEAYTDLYSSGLNTGSSVQDPTLFPDNLCFGTTPIADYPNTFCHLSYDQVSGKWHIEWKGGPCVEDFYINYQNLNYGHFTYNYETNNIMYVNEPEGMCIAISCLNLCTPPSVVTSIDKVVSANAVMYNDNWTYDDNVYPETSLSASSNAFFTAANDYEKGKKGKWRVRNSYVYRERINSASERVNRDEGTFTLTPFVWNAEDPTQAQDVKWVKTSEVTKFSPNGSPLEDKNILNIYSTSKYGYNHTVPVLVAQNAQDHTVLFESFENLYTNHFEDNLAYNASYGIRVSSESHTGDYSIQLRVNSLFNIGYAKVEDNVLRDGSFLVRGWFKSPQGTSLDDNLYVNDGTTDYRMTKVSSAGEWELYEAYVPVDPATTVGTQLNFSIKSTMHDVYMDDVRLQPTSSEMVCYVYDNAQRLIAVFDDQHYSMLYQYNAEGLLVRKLKETTEGVKTISETHYNKPGQTRQ